MARIYSTWIIWASDRGDRLAPRACCRDPGNRHHPCKV